MLFILVLLIGLGIGHIALAMGPVGVQQISETLLNIYFYVLVGSTLVYIIAYTFVPDILQVKSKKGAGYLAMAIIIYYGIQLGHIIM